MRDDHGPPPPLARVAFARGGSDTGRIEVLGRLDAHTLPAVWHESNRLAAAANGPAVTVDVAGVTYCDGGGAALLVNLELRLRERGFTPTIVGATPAVQQLLDLFCAENFKGPLGEKFESVQPFEQVGIAVTQLWKDLREQVAFIGELLYFLVICARRPSLIRWRDLLLATERVGVDALPIVCLIGGLIGLIMAFQAAIPMKQFGTEIYVANLIGLSMLRELGPLMTAIVLAGRSGSAFAAEIGTMKVNDEISALLTMGLDPVRFLVVPRVLAAIVIMPLLTVFAMLSGLLGGLVVFVSMGFPFVVYYNQIVGQINLMDPLGGLLKALVFGILVAGVGCLRGLQTKTGASAVGVSTTSAVVSSIVLIAFTDGIFAVVFYFLGI
jgi:phospholipid/cholesterol/gamma-HCH transport system permease protein